MGGKAVPSLKGFQKKGTVIVIPEGGIKGGAKAVMVRTKAVAAVAEGGESSTDPPVTGGGIGPGEVGLGGAPPSRLFPRRDRRPGDSNASMGAAAPSPLPLQRSSATPGDPKGLMSYTDPETGIAYADVTTHPWWTWVDQRVHVLPQPEGLLKPQRGEVRGVGCGLLRVAILNGPKKGDSRLLRPRHVLLDRDYEPIVDPPEEDEDEETKASKVVTEEEAAAAGFARKAVAVGGSVGKAFKSGVAKGDVAAAVAAGASMDAADASAAGGVGVTGVTVAAALGVKGSKAAARRAEAATAADLLGPLPPTAAADGGDASMLVVSAELLGSDALLPAAGLSPAASPTERFKGTVSAGGATAQ